ncbi:MAG: glutamate--cysteine ligase, partial [Calditrichia bacterium]|nr:glutamate--cysteine ligase [Calditrichia bacterium]
MGEEIDTSLFTELDFIEYKNRLRAETELLGEWFQQGRFVANKRMGGYELESWLVDKQYNPSPINEEFLKRMNSEWVTPELSRFNVELNGPPVE